MIKFPRKLKQFNLPMRAVALLLTGVFVYTVFLPGAQLYAQTFRRFEEGSRSRMDQKIDRAARLQDEQSWSNYVELGIATERTEWEQEAYDELQKTLSAIEAGNLTEQEKATKVREAAGAFDAASDAWQTEAETLFQEERGKFRARSESISVGEVADGDYEALIAAAEAAVAATTEFALGAWEAAIAPQHQAIEQAFESALASEMDRARSAHTNLSPLEQQAFEDELDRVAGELRQEFEVRDNFYLVRARNRYVALKRGDDLNARLASEKGSADAVGEALIADAQESLATDTENMLGEAVASTEAALEGANAADFESIGNNWETKVEALIDAGLQKWETAEEDLYKRRLVWQEETKSTREQGETIWQANHEKLKTARDQWLKQVEQQINEGRAQWQAKFTEFDRNREKADQELADYIQEQKEAWEASSKELGSIISGGGGALLEAKDAVRYYETLLTSASSESNGRDAELYQFYQEEYTYMAGAVGRFQRILADAEGVVRDQMHSGQNYTGLLRDVRLFAGDLPETVAAIDEDDFRADLSATMQARGEDFLLYRRDLDDLADRNAVFTARAGELAGSAQFDYNAAASIADLRTLVNGIDRKYDEHRYELAKILDSDRSALPDDAARLAAIKSEIATWLGESTIENKRLKKITTDYFNNGLGGYYLTGNEGDPYLMTRAEYEWELLRRERNYLAKKLQRAEAVKSYADLAFQNEAGLEMAAVTTERAEVAKAHADLKELEYQLIRGDVNLPADVVGNPARAREVIDALLVERGVNVDTMLARRDRLAAETALLTRVRDLNAPATGGDIDDLVSGIEAYFVAWNVADDARPGHILGILRNKLLDYRNRVLAGASAQEVADRWTVIAGGAGALRGELDALTTEYDFTGLSAARDLVRTRAAERTLPMLQDDIAVKKEEIKANALLLAQAKEELEQAKKAYREARIDFDVLRQGNAEDLIRIELGNTTQSLAGVLHRMSKIEDMPGMENRLLDPVTEGQLKYLHEVSQRETARQDQTYAVSVLAQLEGLEESKKRVKALEDTLGANNLAALAPEQIAKVFIDQEANLVNRDATVEELRSQPETLQAFDALGIARTAYLGAQTAYDTAVADNKPQAEVETLRAGLLDAREKIFRATEAFIAAGRAEERGRRDAVFHLLGEKDAGGDAYADALRKRTAEKNKQTTDEIYAVSEAGAARLKNFLNDNQGKSSGELLKLANDATAALARPVGTGLNGYGNGVAAGREAAVWSLVSAWLVQNRALIDQVNALPETSDGRPVSEKWTELLDLAAELEDDADYYREFEAAIPDSKDDAWVTAFRNDRAALATRLTAALSAADPVTAYRALAQNDRETLASYGYFDPARGDTSLQAIDRALRADLAGLDTNFRQVYGREQARASALTLNALQIELTDKQRTLGEAETEKGLLVREKLTAAPGLIPAIDARIAALDAVITPLRAQVATLRDQARTASTFLQEMQQPGSSGSLVGLAVGAAYQLQQDAALLGAALARVEKIAPERRAEPALASGDRVKAIIGFYRTDAAGAILRDGSGVALIGPEFTALGVTDPNANLIAIIGGNQKGPDLLRWSERLTAWTGDARNREKAAPELIAAVSLLEDSVRELIAARAIIDHRYDSAAALEAQAKADRDLTQKRQEKLGLVRELEAALAEAVRGAEENQQDPVAAALAVLEKPANARVLALFDGYDASGKADGVVDAEAAARIQELKHLAADLRASRLGRELASATGQYAALKGQYLEALYTNPLVAEPGRDAFLAAYPQLKGDGVIDEIAALPEADFRAKVLEWLRTPPPASKLFAGEIIGLLHTSTADGAALKAETLAKLNTFQDEIEASLNAGLDPVDRITLRDRDLAVRTSVADLITAWSVRADTARGLVGPAVDALDPGESIENAKIIAAQSIEVLTTDPATNGYQADLVGIINAATDTAGLKTALRSYLDTLTNPAGADLATLTDELYASDLRRSLAIADGTPDFQAQYFSDELRDMIAVRAYTQATLRYDAYTEQRGADTEAVRSAAALDLTGLNGAFAEWILVRDFDEFSAASPATDLIAAGAGRRTMADYMGAYLRDRHSAPEALPNGGLVAAERLALREFQRILSDAGAAGGIAALDERNYFGDFAGLLLLARAQDFVSRNSITLNGATAADRAAGFRASFEAMLDDPAYRGADGKTLRERNLLAQDREALFQFVFNNLDYGVPLEQQLPPELERHRLYGTLGIAPAAADEYLPDELRGIPNYATLNYRTLAEAVSPQTAAALARIEVMQAASTMEAGLSLSDADFAAVVARAGYGAAPAALQSELTGLVRAYNLRALAGGQTVEEALAGLRQQKVIQHFYTNPADLNEFMTAHGATVTAVEERFFAELEKSHADLRTLAKEQRGEFLRAAIERARGGPSAFYDALSAQQQTRLNDFQTRLFAGISAEQATALKDAAPGFQRAFDLRSGQELVTSGLFEQVENEIKSFLLRAADKTVTDAARENPAALSAAFVEQFYTSAGLSTGLGAQSAAFVAAVPGLGSLLERAVADIDPTLRDTLRDERVLVERFLSLFAEADAERRELRSLFTDPARLDPDAALSLDYAAGKAAAFENERHGELARAVVKLADAHERYLTNLETKYGQDLHVAGKLAEFAALRGDAPDFKASRFSSYRTYIDVEKPYQAKDYDAYLADRDPADPLQSKEEYLNGMVLRSVSLGQDSPEALLNGNWENALVSDGTASAGSVTLGTATTETLDDRTMELRAVNSVSSLGVRNGIAGDDAELRHTYFENLANNYLEAVSRLNGSLNAVLQAADLADRRENAKTTAADIAAKVKAAYNPAAGAGANNLNVVRDLKLDADARLADHSETKISNLQGAILGIQSGFNDAARDFAGAGRRRQVSTMQQVDFLKTVFEAASADFYAAEAQVTALSDQATILRGEMSGLQRTHVDRMNLMAETWREFTFRNDELETRLAVQEYAETPYLFAATGDSASDENSSVLEEYRGDAKEEYELALAAFNAKQEELNEASFQVQTQDNLADFNEIVTGLAAGQAFAPLEAAERAELLTLQDRKYRAFETLSAAEETRLSELFRRDLNEKYGELIRTRADHIAHTMRMVRIHKASELVNAEIQRRRIVADEKKRAFEEILARNFSINAQTDDAKNARNAVYKRLALQVEAGTFNFYNEYKSWYWGFGGWAQDVAGTAQGAAMSGNFQLPQITQGQIIEGLTGTIGAAMLPGGDREAVAKFLGLYGGQLAEFGMFKGVYYSLLNQIAQRDLAQLELQITTVAMMPVIATGTVMMAMGTGVYGMAMTLIAAIFTIPVGMPMAPIGAAAIAAGASMVQMGMREIAKAQAKFLMNQLFMWVLQANALAVSGTKSTAEVWAKHKEYMDAQARLDYFTKVPDMKTMKERMIQYGAHHKDDPNDHAGDPNRPDLYQLTDDDLRYLFDRPNGADAVYLDANGAARTLSDAERNESLDLTASKRVVEYRDSFGTQYDPTRQRTDGPNNAEGGYFYFNDAPGVQYVRFKTAGHGDETQYAYAPKKTGTATDRAYDMGNVFEKTVAHGQVLRDARRDAYLAAGDAAADATFIMNERDQNFENLFGQAAGHVAGGREFTGYAMTYEDYNANAQKVASSRMDQMQTLQQKEWDLRRQEMQDRYDAWEKRIATIMERGRKSWSGSEDRFLQEWRKWERDYDQDVAEGKKAWDERVKEHFAKKEKWENETRANASKFTVARELSAALDGLNAQIATAEQNLGLKLERQDKIAAINQAVADIQNSMPSGGAMLKKITANIEKFNTNVSIAGSIGGDFSRGVDSVAAEFREAMAEQKEHMTILNNIRIYEEYRKMLDNFKAQITVQNEQVENQTMQAALSAGYVRQGDVYIKQGGASSAIGVVHAYKWFDVDAAVDGLLKESGGAIKPEHEIAGDPKSLKGGEMVNFLKNRSTVEVEAFFYTQKLVIQSVIEKIQGRGTQAQRETSRDPGVIGLFSAWVGKGPDGEMAGYATQAGGKALEKISGGMGAKIMKYGVYGGYGELGSSGMRPGGAPLGFYPELEMMSEYVGKQDAQGLASAGGTINPISTTLNSFNPLAMAANIYRDVEVGTRVYGHDRGTMIGGAVMKAAKPVLKVAVNAVAAAVATAGNIIAPGVAVALGAAIAVAGNALVDSIQVGADGKVTIKSNATIWRNALISGVTTAVTGGLAALQVAGTISQAMQQTLNTVNSIAGSVVQSSFDEGGRFNLERGLVQGGKGALIGAVGAGIGGALGGSDIANAFGSTLASTTATWAECRTGGAAACQQYDAMQRPGAEALGAFANAMGAGSALGKLAADPLKRALVNLAPGKDAKDFLAGTGKYKQPDPNQTDQTRRAAEALQGLGAWDRFRRGFQSSLGFDEDAWDMKEKGFGYATKEEVASGLDARMGKASDKLSRDKVLADMEKSGIYSPAQMQSARAIAAARDKFQERSLKASDGMGAYDVWGFMKANGLSPGQGEYAEAQRRLKEIGDKNGGNISMEDIQDVAKQMVEAKGGEFKADWGAARQLANTVRGQDSNRFAMERWEKDTRAQLQKMKFNEAQVQKFIDSKGAIKPEELGPPANAYVRKVEWTDFALSGLSMVGSSVEVGLGVAVIAGTGGAATIPGALAVIHGGVNFWREGENMVKMAKAGLGADYDFSQQNGSVLGDAMKWTAKKIHGENALREQAIYSAIGEVSDGVLSTLFTMGAGSVTASTKIANGIRTLERIDRLNTGVSLGIIGGQLSTGIAHSLEQMANDRPHEFDGFATIGELGSSVAANYLLKKATHGRTSIKPGSFLDIGSSAFDVNANPKLHGIDGRFNEPEPRVGLGQSSPFFSTFREQMRLGATRQDIEAAIAAAPPDLRAAVQTRIETARDFYSQAGFSESRTADHIKGIDFSQPVDVVSIPQGTQLSQFQVPNSKIGNYFANPGTPGSQLGIYTGGRIETQYTASTDVPALRSTASNITDTWSLKKIGWKVETEGGGTQYFTPHKKNFTPR